MLSYNVCISISDMDRPSSSRVRPTGSNRMHRHLVEVVLEEPNLSEEDVEEQSEMEMQLAPGPQDKSLLKSNFTLENSCTFEVVYMHFGYVIFYFFGLLHELLQMYMVKSSVDTS